VLLGALALAWVATEIVSARPAIATLLVARVLQGVSVGLAVGTSTAYLSELTGNRARASLWVAITSSVGFGGGALLTSTLLKLVPSWPTLSYSIYLAFAAAVWLLLALCGARLPAVGGRLMRLPSYEVSSLLPHLSIALGWTVSGLVIGLVPSQLREHGLERMVGPALFAVNVAGVLVQPLARRLGSDRSLLTGAAIIPLGLGALIYGSIEGSVPLLLAGSAFAGSASYGFSYLGGLAAVTRQATRDNEARLVAGYMIFAYLGFGVPTLLLGYLSERIGLRVSLLTIVALATLAAGAIGVILLKRVRLSYASPLLQESKARVRPSS